MKKLLFVFPVVALLAAGCNSQQNTSSNIQPSAPIARNTQSVPTPIATSTTISNPPEATSTPKQTMQSSGVLVATTGGQLYTNQNIGIQVVIPTGWTLGKTYDENSITFQDKEAATNYYEQNKTAFQGVTMDKFVSDDATLVIQYFKDFDSYKNFTPLFNTSCNSIAQCWAPWKGTPDEMKTFTTIGNETMYSSSGCGDICEQEYLIQHKGAVYRFDTASFYYTNDGSIEKTLKFLN